MTEKKLGKFKQAIVDAKARAGDEKIAEDGFVLYQYPDYDTYKEVQVAGNKAKLGAQFVKQSHVKILSDYLKQRLGTVGFGICQGTRRGAEQAWFREELGGSAEVIGTEISDTASQFPNTVQWDFHDINPDWSGRADFVYSNSWDHAFDPAKAFGAWIDALRPGGLMLLDYTKGQSPEAANPLDPFGIALPRLVALIEENFSDHGQLLPGLDTRKTNKEYRAITVVFQKNA